jgi:hypothetical protein
LLSDGLAGLLVALFDSDTRGKVTASHDKNGSEHDSAT